MKFPPRALTRIRGCAAAILLFPSSALAFNVIQGEVIEFTSPEDLLLDPATEVIAVNVVNGANPDLEVNGVTFRGDGDSAAVTGTTSFGGTTVTTSRATAPAGGEITGWAAAPAFTGGADATSAGNLGLVMQSIRWAQGAAAGPSPIPGAGLDIAVSGLTPGSLYDIQLLVNEGAAARDRRWDVAVEGVLVVDDFSSQGELSGSWTASNSFAYKGQFDPGADGVLDVRFEADLGGEGFSGLDGNPILQAIIVHTALPSAPDDIFLSPNEVPATVPVGSLVGLLSSSDVNGGTHSYELVAGAGDSGNALFQTDGDELQTAADLSAEAGNTVSIRVRSTDDTDLSFEKALEIEVTADSDADLLPDAWELGFRPSLADLTGLNSGPGPGADSGDFDADGSADLDEFNNGTDPSDDDSDDDGSNDGDETTNMTDPNDPDSDDDGLNDGDEATAGTNPLEADTDGDTLSDGDEVTNGTNPLLADSDGDGLNDNEDPAPNDPTVFSNTVVLTGEVIEFRGPDDLNLDPANAVIAVDVFGAADSLINGVNFQSDGGVGGVGTATNGGVTVTTTAPNQIADWAVGQTYTGVDATSANNLSVVMQSIRWNGAPDPVTVDVDGLTPGGLYQVQLLFNEGADRARQWDIGVEGELVVDNMTSEGSEGVGVWAPDNGFAYIGEFEGPPDGVLNIVMQQHLGGQDPRGLDNNPILQGVVVQLAAPATPFVITLLDRDPNSGISTITWNSVPGRIYAVDYSPDLSEGLWIELDDGIEADEEQTSFTDDIPRLGGRGFYRVRLP